MKNEIENIRGKKIVVQCRTLDEANRLLKAVDFFHSYNYSNRIISQWEKLGVDACYHLSSAGQSGVSGDKRNVWEGLGYEVIQCSEIVTDDLIKKIDIKHLNGAIERNSRTIEDLTEQLADATKWQESYTAQLALLHGGL